MRWIGFECRGLKANEQSKQRPAGTRQSWHPIPICARRLTTGPFLTSPTRLIALSSLGDGSGPEVCDRARRSRDARFDGKFFIAVTSTRIYCRPICPARSPKDENVRYYPTAAAAQAAGFRPCLRCRPEASPGTPAWPGTSSVVSRALRLIGEGALDRDGVEALADRLGVTARHLRRLFLQHLGATPIEVALTRRVHFAKKLLDETPLPIAQIAFAAGLRQPAAIQRRDAAHYLADADGAATARAQTRDGPDCYRFRLAYRPPYDWPR